MEYDKEAIDVFISRTIREYIKLCNKSSVGYVINRNHILKLIELIDLLSDFFGVKRNE